MHDIYARVTYGYILLVTAMCLFAILGHYITGGGDPPSPA